MKPVSICHLLILTITYKEGVITVCLYMLRKQTQRALLMKLHLGPEVWPSYSPTRTVN